MYVYNIAATIVTHHPLALVAAAGLLCMSATFSGCETSLFSLSAPELNRIRASKTRIDRVLAELHAVLKPLLPTILFCNMAVNVMVFAIASSITNALGTEFGAGVAFLFSLVALFLVVFFGEVFPKQYAISSSLLVARLTGFQVWLVYRTLRQPMRVLNAVVTACERVVQPVPADSHELREEELRLLVELSKNDGVISEGEYELIDGIVELPAVRMRDIMIPRVDAVLLYRGDNTARAVEAARQGKHCKMPVMDVESDDIVGWVDARDVFAHEGGQGGAEPADIEELVRDFQYFSEHDRADQVLERIKGGGGDLYAVVDERGLVVGFFTLQDIMDEVLGHFGEHGAPPPSEIREGGDGYVISGRLSVKEWRDLFDVPDRIPKSATVGGLIVSLLGRVARAGDVVRLENMEMTVRSTWHNRVTEVSLRLMPKEPKAADGAGGKEAGND